MLYLISGFLGLTAGMSSLSYHGILQQRVKEITPFLKRQDKGVIIHRCPNHTVCSLLIHAERALDRSAQGSVS
jgi:hypothetical protein